jgi:hypothetical protein
MSNLVSTLTMNLADLISQIARKVLSDVAYVQTLHGPLRRLIIRAFVMSFRRTFGMSYQNTLSKKIRLTLFSCSQLFRLLWQVWRWLSVYCRSKGKSPARLNGPLISATTTHKYMFIKMHNGFVSAELTIEKQAVFTGYSLMPSVRYLYAIKSHNVVIELDCVQ